MLSGRRLVSTPGPRKGAGAGADRDDLCQDEEDNSKNGIKPRRKMVREGGRYREYDGGLEGFPWMDG